MRKTFSEMMRSWFPEAAVIVLGGVLIVSMRPMMRYMLIKECQGDLRRFQANGIVYAFTPTGRTDEFLLVIHDSVVFGLPYKPGEKGGGISACGFALGSDVLKKGKTFIKHPGTRFCTVNGTRYALYDPVDIRNILRDIIRLRI